MKLLLTGGAGFIGSHTAVVLVKAGFEVVLLDNFSNSNSNVLERMQTITDKPFHCVAGDIRDTALVKQTLLTHAVDAVVQQFRVHPPLKVQELVKVLVLRASNCCSSPLDPNDDIRHSKHCK